MRVFTEAELTYLRTDRLLGRLATVGLDGTPHVTPVGWRLARAESVIEITGRNFAATKKFRDVARTHRAAIVIDDVQPPWRPRGIEIRGRAQAIDHPEPLIRIHPERIVTWGVDETEQGHQARTVASSARGDTP
jgi:pyridoxamine 5'-phosphate oxidase family protein